MGVFDSLGEKSAAALGLELGQSLRAALDQAMARQHIVTLSGLSLTVAGVDIRIDRATITYEAGAKD